MLLLLSHLVSYLKWNKLIILAVLSVPILLLLLLLCLVLCFRWNLVIGDVYVRHFI